MSVVTIRLTQKLTNDKGYGTSPDEYKGWVQGYVGQLGQVVEGVLLCPSPDSNSQHSKTEKLQQK